MKQKSPVWTVLVVIILTSTAFTLFAEIEEPGTRGIWTETREDMPGILLVHKQNETLELQIAPGTGGEGEPLVLVGPTELSVRWNDPQPAQGAEPWPPSITVLEVTYLHDNVQRVEIDGDPAAAALELQALPEIQYAFPVEYTDPYFSRIMPTDRLIVMLESTNTIGQVLSAFPVLEVGPLFNSSNQYVVTMIDPDTTLPSDLAATMTASPLVEWAERDCIRDAVFFYTPNDTSFNAQWHFNATSQSIGTLTAPSDVDVNAPAAWNTTKGFGSIKVAVVDDAIQTNHPDLAANIASSGAYDFYNNDSDVLPDTGNDLHGTSCAGIAGAVGNNSLGVAGIAYQSPIVPIKICSNGNLPYDSQVANSIRHAASYADIISCSWGYVNPATSTLAAVRYALQSGMGGKGSVVFFATGNEAGFIPHAVTFSGTGNYDVRWRYSKDGSISTGLDQCFLDSIWYANGSTEFMDGLTPPALPAGMSGSWTSLVEFLGNRAESGTQMVGSPSISHNQSTYLSQTQNSPSPNSQMWYYMWVNAQPTVYITNTAYYYDYGQVEFRPSGSGSYTTGNPQGGQPCVISYPAAYPETIAVGANDVTSKRSHYAQWGSALDFVAPSDGAWSTLGIQTTDLTGNNGYDSGNYCQADTASKFGGTSAAAPLAAGIGALVRSANAWLSPSQVRNILRSTCKKVSTSWYTYSGAMGGRCDQTGYGQLDASAAVTLASSTPSIQTMAANIKITEVAPSDGICPFFEIYNSSASQPFPLDWVAVTDCEQGGEAGESTFQFPAGTTIPPNGTIVVALGAANQPFIDEITAVINGGGAGTGGIQLFECTASGLLFQGFSIPVLNAATPMAGISLAASDNIVLTITSGMIQSYLSDVIDGMSYGTPQIDSGCVPGVAPGTAESVFAAGAADANNSFQRLGTADTENSMLDFNVMPRSPGRIVYDTPVTTFIAEPVTDSKNALTWTPPVPGKTVIVAASPDPVFNYPAHGTLYPPGSPLGPDMIIHNGPEQSPALYDSPYPPQTPVFYRVWVDNGFSQYSAGVTTQATTLAPASPIPLQESFTNVLDSTTWPYAPNAAIDTTLAQNLITAPYCAQLSSAQGTPQLASALYDPQSVTNVHLVYAVQEGGAGDPPEIGEDLHVEFLNNLHQWQPLNVHPAGMPSSDFMIHEIALPTEGIHSEMRVRFRTTAVSTGPADTDDWFIDEVSLEEYPVLTGFSISSLSATQSVNVPIPIVISALSSTGGILNSYGADARLMLKTIPSDTFVTITPTNLFPFTDGVWSQTFTVGSEPSEQVNLIAGNLNNWTTGNVFTLSMDADNDDMNDGWEYTFFGSVTQANQSAQSDQDQDQFSDYAEFIAGTDPTNAASLLKSELLPGTGGGYTIEWPSLTGRTYRLERSTNLMSGFDFTVTNNMAGEPPTNSIVDGEAPTNKPVYYRLRVTR